MKTKLCKKCKQQKLITFFGKHKLHRDGLQSYCKICKKQISKKYYLLHSKIIIENVRKWYKEHTLYRSRYMRKYEIKNREVIKIKRHNKYIKNKYNVIIWSRNYIKNRAKLDINFRLKRYLSNRIYQALRGNSKSLSTMELIGCSISKLKHHLESKFKKGMSWKNYGKWHVDHIKPCCRFDLSKPEEQRKCFHYTNLQPLWAKDNLEKSDK